MGEIVPRPQERVADSYLSEGVQETFQEIHVCTFLVHAQPLVLRGLF